MKKKSTIVVCGGHVTPALAFIEALKAAGVLAPVVFFGRKYTLEASRTPSFEYQIITKKGIQFVPIMTGRLQRKFTVETIPSLLKIPVGCIQAIWYCFTLHPSIIVSFGGYVALPVAFAGWVFGIPVITHEQTRVAGLANRIIARIAKRICVTFPETVEQFPNDKAVYTGLPMRKDLFAASQKIPFSIDGELYPLMYVTGGGSGAQSLNRIIFPILPALLSGYTIIHQVGEASLTEAEKVRLLLPSEYRRRYIIRAYIPSPDVFWVLSRATLVVGRSGANTVMEVAALGKVAILVPLPWSAGAEQEKNALWLARRGGAVVLGQEHLTADKLAKAIESVRRDFTSFQSRATVFAQKVPHDGAEKMVSEMEKLISAAV